ncbi:choice-of-anchor Q domain-containing protein [Haliscomenobacter hydrossis]|uniref:Polymorphic membrane protein Chlamydia n=1 Tax=Haliscomenobacter hydrossis (strain ATCC 27775 / DSM 1100 / LMG 10767 / O) TaxID=760192 RepID=F4L6P9_HALH1|nr:choice-of-anchor Q domain-containing protein [Haliscomenobacter hydrossis]AEE50880.1 Polymorphic membrane protein Chlamydia [Haliscomenobacter hydrossis DSM 1100]
MNYKTTLHILVLCVFFPILGFAQTSSTGKRIYVAAAATAGSEADGQSWNTAFTDLQLALRNTQKGDSIWIAKGKYFPTLSSDRNISFSIPVGVKIFGGFTGIEHSINDRNWDLHQTIFSGEISSTKKALHVVTLTNPDSSNIIDGIIIEHGAAYRDQSNSNALQRGGGLLIVMNDQQKKGGSIIRNCIFKNNIALSGGAIAIEENSNGGHWKIQNCIFQKNAAGTSGGAIFCSSNNMASILEIDKSQFNLNESGNFGSAISHNFLGNLTIKKSGFDRNETLGVGEVRFDNVGGDFLLEDCTFSGEKMVGGSAIDIVLYGKIAPNQTDSISIIVRRTKFSNVGSGDGGAISISQEGENVKTEIIIEDCDIEESISDLGRNAINIENRVSSSQVHFSIKHCQFFENKIPRRVFGSVNLTNYADIGYALEGIINNCVFYKNAQAININQYKNGKTKLLVLNSTFFNNSQSDILNNRREPDSQIEVTLQNSIFYEKPGPLSAILQNTNSSDLKGFTFNHCLFSAPACKTTTDTLGCGMGNIFGQYPKFVDSSTVQGLKLAPGSVAINAGRWDPGLSALDVLGQPRVQDCKVDLGAYESPSVLNPADTLVTKAQIRSTPVNLALGEIGIQQISGGFPPYQLRWENGDSTRVRSGLPAGQYQLTITDQQGCFKIYRYTVPFTTATRDVPHAQGQLSLVPNPLMAGQQLSLRYRDFLPGKWHLQVLDLTGKVVLQRSLVLQTKGETSLPTTQLPAGMYLLTLQRNEAFLSAKMMVIDRQ